ncbi:MAG: prepilin peptidase [Armatimonadetes bacterium]|nr:prepilin peptidase [Armatimonadota bacterium]
MTDMSSGDVLLWLLIFWLGAAVGSFLNVVIYRLPRGMSLLRPRSHCPSCGTRLSARDLIPILSWLVLRGRCRYCAHPVSVRYTVVELASALLACASLYFWGPTIAALCCYAVCAALLVACFVDLDHMIIPDQVHLVIAVAGVVMDIRWMVLRGVAGMVTLSEKVGAHTLTMAWPHSAVGAAMGAGIFLAIAYLAQLAFRKPALGMGDVKLGAAMGTVLGPGLHFVAFFLLATVVGGLVGAGMLIASRGRGSHYIPFGPTLAVAGIAMTLAPEAVSGAVLAPFLV